MPGWNYSFKYVVRQSTARELKLMTRPRPGGVEDKSLWTWEPAEAVSSLDKAKARKLAGFCFAASRSNG